MNNDELDRIEITEDNIKKINYDMIIAVTVAEGGAMGDSGGLQVVDEEMKVFHSNINTGKVPYEELAKKFKLLKGFNCSPTDINNKNLGWKWYYLGGGNALLIREKYYKFFNDELVKTLGKDYKKSDLYLSWFSILQKVKDKVDKDPWWFSFEFNSIDEIIDYIKVNNEAPSHINKHMTDDGHEAISCWIDYDMGLFKITKFLRENNYVFDEYYDNKKYLYLFHQPLDIKDIDNFNIEKVSYLILRCFNIERICEGTIKEFLESGLLLKLIERAKELKGENNEL